MLSARAPFPRIRTHSNACHGPLIADLVWRGSITELRTKAAEKEAVSRLTEPELNLLSGDWHAKKETRSTMLEATRVLNVASLRGADIVMADAADDEEASRNSQEARARRLAQYAVLTRRITEIVASVPVPNVLQVNESNTTPKIRQLIEVLRVRRLLRSPAGAVADATSNVPCRALPWMSVPLPTSVAL